MSPHDATESGAMAGMQTRWRSNVPLSDRNREQDTAGKTVSVVKVQAHMGVALRNDCEIRGDSCRH